LNDCSSQCRQMKIATSRKIDRKDLGQFIPHGRFLVRDYIYKFYNND